MLLISQIPILVIHNINRHVKMIILRNSSDFRFKKLKFKEIEVNLSTKGSKSPNFTYSSHSRYKRLDKIMRPYSTRECYINHREKKSVMWWRIFYYHLHLIMKIWNLKSCLEREKVRKNEGKLKGKMKGLNLQSKWTLNFLTIFTIICKGFDRFIIIYLKNYMSKL